MRRLALDIHNFVPIARGRVLPHEHSYFSRGVEFQLLRRVPDVRRFLEKLRDYLQTKGYSVLRDKSQQSDVVRLRSIGRTNHGINQEDHFRLVIAKAKHKFSLSLPTEDTHRLKVIGMPSSLTRVLRGNELHITDRQLDMMSRGARKRRLKK